MGFLNKSVIVTGGSSGIGAALAKAFTKEKANVTIIGRNGTKLKTVAEECERIYKKPLVLTTDMTKDNEVEKAVKDVIKTFGDIDVLINNAGVLGYGSLLDGKFFKTFDPLMNLNIRSAALMTSLCVPHLTKRKGNIVNISSVAASTVPRKPQFLSYYISKAALDHFSRCAAAELATVDVRVNVVSPGPTSTDIITNFGATTPVQKYGDLTALKRVCDTQEVSDLVLFISSEKGKSITGSVFTMDNGFLVKQNYHDLVNRESQ